MSFEPSPVSSSLPVCAEGHGIEAQEAGQMERAVVLWNQVLMASNDLIRARFELGAVVLFDRLPNYGVHAATQGV